MASSLLYCAICAFLGVVVVHRYRNSCSKLPLPPGPRRLPLVGNMFDIPKTFEWETYMEWSKKYDSDIIHLSVAGQSIIVLSSAKAADDLLTRRSSIYSDRARMPMVNELMGWDFGLGLGDRWRAHRRLFQNSFSAKASRTFRPKELVACHGMLLRTLQNPDGIMDHLRHMAGELIMSVAYGINVLPSNDPYISMAKQAMHSLSIANVPGRYLVDSMPILKYVPEWLPGAEFKRQAREWRKLALAARDTPYADTKRNITMGTASPSFTSYSLRDWDKTADKETLDDNVRSTSGSMYLAGSDTTVSALGTFVLGMLSNPEAQRKAQLEIDSVVGHGRLPNFDDEMSMPYISALVQEVLRWKSVVPLGIPHFLAVEDEYRGYRMPANSIVIANTWAISHDEVPKTSQDMYPDPYAFKPERFLLDGKPNPDVRNSDAAFGFGRRICPGRYMATSSMWIAIVSMLATFDITKAVGDDGKVIEPTYEFFPGFVSMPLPFKCSIIPRSQEAVALIRATAKNNN
ncbi:cytochrome P450 [Mycena sp. CBHHK59/15]|nr:cytochrome P450 [Mycena sp. CBHHK59/15]